MSYSKARSAEMDAINLSNEQVIEIIDNYIQEKDISYTAFQKELNIPVTAVSQVKRHNTRSFKLWKWADAHRKYLNNGSYINHRDKKTEKEIITILSNYFKVWRIFHGLTQVQLAQACNCSSSLIEMAEHGTITSVNEMFNIMKSAFKNTYSKEATQMSYCIPEEKRKLFIQLCTSIADTLVANNNLEEEGD